MQHKVEFPYLVMLISGGHCLLAMAQDVDQYRLLGSCSDNAPGLVLDKVARRLKLQTLRPELRDVSGGRAIQIVGAEGGGGDPTAFPFNIPLTHKRNCNFTFSGMHTQMLEKIEEIEKELKLSHDEFIPGLPHFCASVEYTIAKHLCMRLQRGIEYANTTDMWAKGGVKNVVLSGGVASNLRLKSSIEKVCTALQCKLTVPEPKYCTDNGVMIAWNGLERYRAAKVNPAIASSILSPEDAMKQGVASRVPFGQDISVAVAEARIKCKFVDIR